ncbi:MAG: aminopeptidase [Gemmatimonadota bacterium]|nr:MAG: aminopeptidase [Gemmatimonadota bacterium]
MNSLREAAHIAVRDCLGVKPGESVLVITDIEKRKIGYALWEAARDLGAEAMMTEILPRRTHGEEPPKALAEFMKHVDVFIGPTSKSLSHTRARQRACEAGARGATLPNITLSIMRRALQADYTRIAEASLRVAEYLTRGATAKLTTREGTNLIMSLVGMKGMADTGQFHKPGEFGNLPSGEAYIAPVENSAHGTIVIDGSMAGIGLLSAPIRLTVRNGYATKISGGREAQQLSKLTRSFGRPGRNIAELGLGTNYKAKITGNILEDEKVAGTVHIALGDNASIGGTVSVPSHMDGLLLNPTLEIDDQTIMRDGKLLI